MAQVTFTGTVKKAGVSKYGPWAVVTEEIVKRDGGTFTVDWMCSGDQSLTEGAVVTVAGEMSVKKDTYIDRNGQEQVAIKRSVNDGTFTVDDDDGSEIPF